MQPTLRLWSLSTYKANELNFLEWSQLLIFFQMPLSAKERKERWRQKIKSDPIRHAEYLEAERQRWKERRDAGKLSCISNLTERDARRQRRKWMNAQRLCRKKRNQFAVLTDISPPVTPEHDAPEVDRRRTRSSGPKQRRSRTLKRKSQEMKKLEDRLEQAKRLTNKYKKRLERQKRKHAVGQDDPPQKNNLKNSGTKHCHCTSEATSCPRNSHHSRNSESAQAKEHRNAPSDATYCTPEVQDGCMNSQRT